MRRLFFSGNCQARFAAAAFAGICPDGVEVHVIGARYGSNASFEGKAPNYLDQAQAAALVAAHPDDDNIWFLQQTVMKKYGVEEIVIEDFTRTIPYPHLQFRAMWPENGDADPDSRITRRWHIERLAIVRSLLDSNFPQDFVDSFLQLNAERVLFHTHSHPAGEAFGTIWREVARLAPEDLRPMIAEAAQAMGESAGIDLHSNHPVSTRIADLLGVSWHRTPAYLAASAISEILDGTRTAWSLSPEDTEALVRGDASTGAVYRLYRALRRVREHELASRIVRLAGELRPQDSSMIALAFWDHCHRNHPDEARQAFLAVAMRAHLSQYIVRALRRHLALYARRLPWVRALEAEALADPALNADLRLALAQAPAAEE
jgi:hypothetical protein